MEVLMFIFLFLNIIVLVICSYFFYSLQLVGKKRALIYSDFINDFWEKGDLDLNDICSND